MGEIADGIINGDFDYVTGEYLGEGDGFPRTTQDLRKDKPKPNKGASTRTRVRSFIQPFYKDRKLNQHVVSAHVTAYCLATDRAHLNANKQYRIVHKEWDEFKEFVRTLHTPLDDGT